MVFLLENANVTWLLQHLYLFRSHPRSPETSFPDCELCLGRAVSSDTAQKGGNPKQESHAAAYS